MDTAQILRLLIGDIDSAEPFLTDAQIDYYLDTYDSDPETAAPYAAQAVLAAISLRATDETTGAMSTSWSQRADAYRKFLDLRGWLSVGGAALAPCYAGGVVQSEIDDAAADSSLAPRRFTIALHDTET